jgi:hypothetical protein
MPMNETPKPAVYICPMHAEVRGTRPGRCPECGMSLVPDGAVQIPAPHARQPDAHRRHGRHHGRGDGRRDDDDAVNEARRRSKVSRQRQGEAAPGAPGVPKDHCDPLRFLSQ